MALCLPSLLLLVQIRGCRHTKYGIIFIQQTLSVLEGNFYHTTTIIGVNENKQILFAEYRTSPHPFYCSFSVICTNERAHAFRISVTRNVCQTWDGFFFSCPLIIAVRTVRHDHRISYTTLNASRARYVRFQVEFCGDSCSKRMFQYRLQSVEP
jgi:hypothetical protein